MEISEKQFKNFDKYIAESQLARQKFDEEMKQMKADSDKKWNEIKTDSDRQWSDWKKESNKKYQDLIHKLGTFLEDIAAPNIPIIAKEVFKAGESQFFSIRAKVKNLKGETREFDAVYISETTFLLNESKSNPKIEYIDDFINAN